MNPAEKQMIITIVCSVLASSGFWALVMKLLEKRSAKTMLLIGLAHDRIINLGKEYIRRGSITAGEYDDLYTYLYVPYRKGGGNGTAEKIMKEVAELPITAERSKQ